MKANYATCWVAFWIFLAVYTFTDDWRDVQMEKLKTCTVQTQHDP